MCVIDSLQRKTYVRETSSHCKGHFSRRIFFDSCLCFTRFVVDVFLVLKGFWEIVGWKDWSCQENGFLCCIIFEKEKFTYLWDDDKKKTLYFLQQSGYPPPPKKNC